MPFFSIIIPTYNRKNSLEKAINSVLSQTFTDFEILVMDDGSQDGTDSYIYSIADSRIFYEWKENTGGPANPRNRGIKESKGEWICFLDADDFWTPDKLQSCYNAINRNVDFIYHDLFLVNGRRNLFFFPINKLKGRQMSVPILEDLLLRGNAISTSSVLVRKSILAQTDGFDERQELVAGEDYKLWLKIATVTNNFLYVNQCLGYYFDSGSGISNKNMSMTYYNAIVDYLHLLGKNKANRALSFSKYINAKFISTTGQYFTSIEDLVFCLKYAKLEIQLKSLYIFFLILIKLSRYQILAFFESQRK